MTYLVIRRLSRKDGDPLLLGMESDLDLVLVRDLEADLLYRPPYDLERDLDLSCDLLRECDLEYDLDLDLEGDLEPDLWGREKEKYVDLIW